MTQSSRKSQGLTVAQQKALERLQDFVTSEHRLFRVDGYAGTGKSFLICHFIEWLQDQDYSFVAAAPTNKAAKNLMQVAMAAGISLEVKTVAQLLGQQPEINEATGLEEFTSNSQAQFDDFEVIIIDEFSMINRNNFEVIFDAAALTIDTKLIFVGDSAQLPPVKEDSPVVAASQYIDDSVTLEQVIRYEGAIARVAEQIRTQAQYQKAVYPFQTSPDETIVCHPRAKWLETVTEYFQSPRYQSHPDYARILVWKNKTALAANMFVRSRLWGKDAPPYVPGDRLIAKKPLFRPRPGKKGKNKWTVLINNSEECTVTEEPSVKEIIIEKQHYTCWSVPVMTDGGTPFKLSILHEASETIRNQKIQEYVAQKQWLQYFDLSRSFDDVTYGYALTVHKAQGSSIDYVFLDAEDMKYCPDLQKILYTALTRTKICAFIPEG